MLVSKEKSAIPEGIAPVDVCCAVLCRGSRFGNLRERIDPQHAGVADGERPERIGANRLRPLGVTDDLAVRRCVRRHPSNRDGDEAIGLGHLHDLEVAADEVPVARNEVLRKVSEADEIALHAALLDLPVRFVVAAERICIVKRIAEDQVRDVASFVADELRATGFGRDFDLDPRVGLGDATVTANVTIAHDLSPFSVLVCFKRCTYYKAIGNICQVLVACIPLSASSCKILIRASGTSMALVFSRISCSLLRPIPSSG